MKEYLAISIIVAVLSIGVFLVLYYQNENVDNCSNYVMEENKIKDLNIPRYRNYEWASPINNSTLREVVITSEDEYSTDSEHREVYYSDSDNVFWLRDGEGLKGATWYGPFTGFPSK